MVQFNGEELSPTMEAIFAHFQEEGKRKGIEQGIVKGIEQVALEMLNEGSSVEFIAKVTRLDIEAIEKLRKLNG